MLQKRSCGVQLTKEKEKNCKPMRLTNKKIVTLKTELRQYLDSNGYLSYSAKKKKYIILGTNSPKNGLAKCPQCNVGQLMMIRSPATKKRFIGCSNLTMAVPHLPHFYKRLQFVELRNYVTHAFGH